MDAEEHCAALVHLSTPTKEQKKTWLGRPGNELEVNRLQDVHWNLLLGLSMQCLLSHGSNLFVQRS